MKLLIIVILLISLIITSTIIVFYLEKQISDNKIKIETKYSKEINIIEDKFNSNSDNDGTSGGGTCSSISETEVKELIDARISSSGEGSSIFYNTDGCIKTLTGSELGFDVSDNGNEIIFNKEVNFNKKSQFNSIVNIKILEGMIVPMDLGMYGIYGQDRNKGYFDYAIEEIEKSGFYLCDGICHHVVNGDGTVYGRKTPNMKSKIIQGINQDDIDDIVNNKRPNYAGDENTLTIDQIPNHKHYHTHLYDNPIVVVTSIKVAGDNKVDTVGRFTEVPLPSSKTTKVNLKSNCEECGNTKLSPVNFTNKNQQFYFIYWPKPWTWGNINHGQPNLDLCKITTKKEGDIEGTPNISNFSDKPWSNYIDSG